MESYDQLIPDLMRKYAIPGGAVAVLRDGKLLYARGFGYADVENKTPVQPDALFRIASVSKPITSAAIMKLVEEGKLKLDELISRRIGLDGVNDALAAMKAGEVSRSVIVY